VIQEACRSTRLTSGGTFFGYLRLVARCPRRSPKPKAAATATIVVFSFA
jgi:hypothetical protein